MQEYEEREAELKKQLGHLNSQLQQLQEENVNLRKRPEQALASIQTSPARFQTAKSLQTSQTAFETSEQNLQTSML